MRARWTTAAAVALVAASAVLLGLVALDTESVDRSALRRSAAGDGAAAERFVEAWERSRSATYVAVGRFERRSQVTGASIASEDYVAQRPPRRIHRQMGGVEGRDDDRLLVCPAPPEGSEADAQPCRLGDAGGLDYEESVAREVAGVRSVVGGGDALYSVDQRDDGCFLLDLRRADPRAPFGLGATFCFDPATGAPIRTEVRYEGGISESLLVEEVRTEVGDADLEP